MMARKLETGATSGEVAGGAVAGPPQPGTPAAKRIVNSRVADRSSIGISMGSGFKSCGRAAVPFGHPSDQPDERLHPTRQDAGAPADVVQQAQDTGKSIRDIVIDEGLMDADDVDTVLQPENMTQPGGLDEELMEKYRD